MKNIISESNCIRIDGTLIALNTINIIKIKDGVRISDVDGDFYFDLLIQDILIDGDAPQSANLLLEYFKDNAFSAGGVTPPDPTATLTISITGLPDEYEVSINGAVWPNNMKTFPLGTVLTNIVPTADGYTFTPSSQGPITMDEDKTLSFTAQASGAYVVERTFRIDLANQYGSTPEDVAPYYVVLKPDDSLLQIDNGFTSPTFVDDTNASSTLLLVNSGAFAGTTARVSQEQEDAGNTGVFPNNVINTAWSLNGSTNSAVTISGLNATKFYQIYSLMPVSNEDSVRGMTIDGVTKNRTATSILGSFGLAANGLNDPEFIVFNNIQGTSVQIEFNRVSGDFGAFISLIVIEESNIQKP